METRPALEQARQMLADGRKADALVLIKTVLISDRRNVGAWWLAVQAAPDRDEARAALRVVLKLQPDHAGARALTTRLDPAPNTPAAVAPLEPIRARRSGCLSRKSVLRLAVTLGSSMIVSLAILFLIANLTGSFSGIPLLGQLPIMPALDDLGLLSDASDDTPRRSSIHHGAQITGTIRDGERQEFVFSGYPGTQIFVGIGFAAIDRSANTSGALDLLDPDNYRAISSTGEIPGIEMPALPFDLGAFSFLQFTLDKQGTWRVRLNGRAGQSAGAYVLSMQCYPEGGCRGSAGN